MNLGLAVALTPPLDVKAGIRIMMEGYPAKWIPTQNGIAMQRARMILPLAFLVRAKDTPEHREWLAAVVDGFMTRAHCEGPDLFTFTIALTLTLTLC